MRLHLTLTPNTEPVPFNYQHQLTGALHKWLGQNDLHDKISLYSFSWLRGNAERVEGGLNFPNGAKWFISFWEEEYAQQLVKGILNEPSVFKGMNVTEVQIQENPEFGTSNYFKVASPVLLRMNLDDGSRKHLITTDEKASELLNERMKSKMLQANLNSRVEIRFDEKYLNPKTKLVDIKGTKLKTNICPVLIEGDEEALKFAWNVGVGELTGSGLGALI
tara:strand:+ start:519 stop:1178 length:660 start_codon:yes stop_codon:yes gene_type:complete